MIISRPEARGGRGNLGQKKKKTSRFDKGKGLRKRFR